MYRQTNYVQSRLLMKTKNNKYIFKMSPYHNYNDSSSQRQDIGSVMVTILMMLIVIIFVSKLPIHSQWYDPGQLTGYTDEEHRHKDDDSNDDAQLVEFAGCLGSSQCCGMVTPLCGTSDLQCVHGQCINTYSHYFSYYLCQLVNISWAVNYQCKHSDCHILPKH